LVENETRNKLKCLKLNNGGKYYSKEFDSYCSYHGLHRDKTIPKTPKKMVSKMMTKEIMECARSMRLHA